MSAHQAEEERERERERERESWNGWAVASCCLVYGFLVCANCGGRHSAECRQVGPAQQLAQEAEATDSASQGKAVNNIPGPNQGETTLSDSVKSGKVACSSATPYQRTVL